MTTRWLARSGRAAAIATRTATTDQDDARRCSGRGATERPVLGELAMQSSAEASAQHRDEALHRQGRSRPDRPRVGPRAMIPGRVVVARSRRRGVRATMPAHGVTHPRRRLAPGHAGRGRGRVALARGRRRGRGARAGPGRAADGRPRCCSAGRSSRCRRSGIAVAARLVVVGGPPGRRGASRPTPCRARRSVAFAAGLAGPGRSRCCPGSSATTRRCSRSTWSSTSC